LKLSAFAQKRYSPLVEKDGHGNSVAVIIP
jgi:hypothetical protein